jgi:DNA repair protein SbcC/Rad50
MKLSGFLNKPRWQSKDAAVRRAGVAEDDDAELLASLSSIARQDADANVRATAMKRLADPGLTQRLAVEDADPNVRTEARRLWLDLLAGTHARSPSPAECARLLRAQDDTALIEHVARSASDAALRGAALERVTRAALLAERATSDPAPELRLAALERIDDEAQLERLAERTRKTDKKISRSARERADALRIARGDAGAVEALARSLCERIEKLAREGASDEAQAAADAQWSAIEARAGDSLRTRYQAARALIVAARDRPAAPVEVVVADVVVEARSCASASRSRCSAPAIGSTGCRTRCTGLRSSRARPSARSRSARSGSMRCGSAPSSCSRWRSRRRSIASADRTDASAREFSDECAPRAHSAVQRERIRERR